MQTLIHASVYALVFPGIEQCRDISLCLNAATWFDLRQHERRLWTQHGTHEPRQLQRDNNILQYDCNEINGLK
jgi:hypothetical protein